MKRKPSKQQSKPDNVIKASNSGKKLGLPTLALEAIKLTAKPSFSKFTLGLGVLPDLIQPPTQSSPELKLPVSAGINSIQASQSHTVSTVQTQPQTQEPPKANLDMVLAASTIATGFAEAASTISLSSNDSQKFLDISSKLLDIVTEIEKNMIDEQDTTIKKATDTPATTIVQQPFMPTEAPVPQSDPISQLLSLVGGLVNGIGFALSMGASWLGSMWSGFVDKLAYQIKQLFNIGWSRIVTGFNAASEFVTNAVNTVMSWVDASMATVSNWIKTAADKIKSLWSAFDFSKLNILDFDLSGLWSKMQDLSIFGDWGNAIKNALNLFGGTGLDALRTVFDVAGKVWNFVKPIIKIIGKVARFLGPVGFLFGLATQVDDIMGLIGDASAIINAPTTEGKITGVKTMISHAMRIIAESILPSQFVNGFFNSDEQNKANNDAVESGAVEATGNVFGADYRIKDVSKLNEINITQLKQMLDSGDYSDEDEDVIKSVIKSKETKGETVDVVINKQEQPDVVSVVPASTYTQPMVPIVPYSQPTIPSYTSSYNQTINWKKEIEIEVKKIIDTAESQNHEINIETVVNDVKSRLSNRFVKTAMVRESEFEITFERMRSNLMNFYYNNYNKNKIKETETETISKPIVSANTVEPQHSVIPSAAVSTPSYTESQSTTVNVAGQEPTIVDPKPDTSSKPSETSSSSETRARAASDFATRHAMPSSTGYCAKYVANSLEAVGYKFVRNGTAKEYVTNGTLQKLGFEQRPLDEPPKQGDISVMGPRYAGHAGHISIFNGKNWVSDFVQRHESPYNGGKPCPGQWMTRWRDTGKSGDFNPATVAEYESKMESSQPGNLGPVAANVMDLSGLSSEMSSLLNQALKTLGLGGIDVIQKSQVPQSSIPQKLPSDKTNLDLDDLLLLENGFD